MDVSLLQGESVVVVQVLRDMPPDVPVHLCCTHGALGEQVTALARGKYSSSNSEVCDAWPLISHVATF